MYITVYSFDSREDLNTIVMFKLRGEAYMTPRHYSLQLFFISILYYLMLTPLRYQ